MVSHSLGVKEVILAASKALVIVESPAKAKTIKKYLGKNFTVKASVGHVMDLPTKELGVDVKKKFAPTYVVMKGKKNILDEIASEAKKGCAAGRNISDQLRKYQISLS